MLQLMLTLALPRLRPQASRTEPTFARVTYQMTLNWWHWNVRILIRIIFSSLLSLAYIWCSKNDYTDDKQLVRTSRLAHRVHNTQPVPDHSNWFLEWLVLKLHLPNNNWETQIINSSATVVAVGGAVLSEQPLIGRGSSSQCVGGFFSICAVISSDTVTRDVLHHFFFFGLNEWAHRCPPGVWSQVVGLSAPGRWSTTHRLWLIDWVEGARRHGVNTLSLTELLLCMFLMWLSFWTADFICEPFIWRQPLEAEAHLKAQHSDKKQQVFHFIFYCFQVGSTILHQVNFLFSYTLLSCLWLFSMWYIYFF